MTLDFKESVKSEGRRLLRLGATLYGDDDMMDLDCPTTPPARDLAGCSPLGQPGLAAQSDASTEPDLGFSDSGPQPEGNSEVKQLQEQCSTKPSAGAEVKQPEEKRSTKPAADPEVKQPQNPADVTDTFLATSEEEDKQVEASDKNTQVLKRPAARKPVMKRPSASFTSRGEPAKSPPDDSPSPLKLKRPAASQDVEDEKPKTDSDASSSVHPPKFIRPAASPECEESGPVQPPPGSKKVVPKAVPKQKAKSRPKSANLPPFKPEFWKWEEQVEGEAKWMESKHGSWKVRSLVIFVV